jgi:hypothetical protein
MPRRRKPPQAPSAQILAANIYTRVLELRKKAEESNNAKDVTTYTRLELACVAKLATLSGEASQIGEAKLVQTPAFRRLLATITDALTLYPEALMAVHRAVASVVEGARS